jgi:hypothetical protein
MDIVDVDIACNVCVLEMKIRRFAYILPSGKRRGEGLIPINSVNLLSSFEASLRSFPR